MTPPKAKVLSGGAIQPAVDALLSGDVIGMPTETVYGLAGNAFDPSAVTKIFAAKARPSFDPLIVHVPTTLNSAQSLSAARILDGSRISPDMAKIINKLAEAFWPGPLTMILPKHADIPDLVTSGLDRVGVRMPSHPLAQKLLTECGRPLAAPSANRFGRISPTTAEHVMDELGDRIPFIVDGGSCEVGVESTVIAVDEDRIWLLRPGKIGMNELAACVNVPVVRAPSVHEKASPGMLASHYAPKKPMLLIQDWNQLPATIKGKSIDLLVTAGDGSKELQVLKTKAIVPGRTAFLSIGSNPKEAAQKLFAAMRDLDSSSSDLILATSVPSTDGLWLAIEDRMRRASTPP